MDQTSLDLKSLSLVDTEIWPAGSKTSGVRDEQAKKSTIMTSEELSDLVNAMLKHFGVQHRQPLEKEEENEEENHPEVFVSGVNPESPLASIQHFEHVSLLRDGLEICGIQEFNSLQKAVVPHLYRGDDIFIIGGERSGKSLSYLIPMVGRLLMDKLSCGWDAFDGVKASANGISALIICADVESANAIKDHLFALLHPTNERNVSYDVIGEHGDLDKLMNRLNIILTTVTFFSELMERRIKMNQDVVSFKNLKYLVYENLDVLISTYSEELDSVREIMNGMIALNYQQVFVGQKWSPEVETIFNSVNMHCFGNDDFYENTWEHSDSTPTVFINSTDQLIRYSQMRWNFLHADNEEDKFSRLQELLYSISPSVHKCIFIVCSTPTIVKAVHKFLYDLPQKRFIRLSRAHSIKSSTYPFANMFKQCMMTYITCFPEKQQVVVLDDQSLLHLNIRIATCLIHYNLPLPNPNNAITSCPRGAERFTCTRDNIRSIAIEKSNPSIRNKRKVIETHFLITGSEVVMPKLRPFWKDLLLNFGIADLNNAIADADNDVQSRESR